MVEQRSARIRGALWGMFIADALAMPVHWYYNTRALDADYGELTGYRAPKERHPDSLLHKSNTGGHGRGGRAGSVIGDVILKGRKHLWSRPQYHYHAGLRAGENTLNLRCVRLLVQSLAIAEGYRADDFLARYVDFMTSADSHNDVYAESFHRDFFANFQRGVAPAACAGAEGHNTASVGGLLFVVPPVLALGSGHEAWLEQLRLTHRSRELEVVAAAIAALLDSLLEGAAPAAAAAACGARLGVRVDELARAAEAHGLDDRAVIGGVFSPACYVSGAVPALLYLMVRYADDPRAALLANARVGGDSCHRGAVLGALLGAALGVEAWPEGWRSGLVAHDELEEEIEALSAVAAT